MMTTFCCSFCSWRESSHPVTRLVYSYKTFKIYKCNFSLWSLRKTLRRSKFLNKQGTNVYEKITLAYKRRKQFCLYHFSTKRFRYVLFLWLYGFLPEGDRGAPPEAVCPLPRDFCPLPEIWSENNRKISIKIEISITIDSRPKKFPGRKARLSFVKVLRVSQIKFQPQNSAV